MLRFTKVPKKDGRETIFILETGSPRGEFRETVRKYVNGLLNSHGGVLYFGTDINGTATGVPISRKGEDEYKLAVDHTIGSFSPFIGSSLYKLSFIDLVEKNNRYCDYKIIELKVSVGELGEIYEDGFKKVYIVDTGDLIGPLYPQELKELILLKYKESIEGAEEALKFTTPNLAAVRAKAKIAKSAHKPLKQPLKPIQKLPDIIELDTPSPVKQKVSCNDKKDKENAENVPPPLPPCVQEEVPPPPPPCVQEEEERRIGSENVAKRTLVNYNDSFNF